MASLLDKLVDAEQWEAEDLVGRLALIAHSAFLHAGFVPYGTPPPSGRHLNQSGEPDPSTARCLSRRYTAPQLAHCEDAAAAVLLCASQANGDLALVAFLTTDGGVQRAYRERLDVATVAPLLSRSLDADVADRRCSRVSRSLATGVCWDLLDELCRANGIPLKRFASLPDDAMVEILKWLRSGVDLARAECACRDLRRVVAEHAGELWRHMYWHDTPPEMWKPIDTTYVSLYEDLMDLFLFGDAKHRPYCKLITKMFQAEEELTAWFYGSENGPWHELMARLCAGVDQQECRCGHRGGGERWPMVWWWMGRCGGGAEHRPPVWWWWRCRELIAKMFPEQLNKRSRPRYRLRWFRPVDIPKKAEGAACSWKERYLMARNSFCRGSSVWLLRVPMIVPLIQLFTALEPEDGITWNESINGRHHKTKLPRNNYSIQLKRRGTGAIHSTSSRYWWRHR